jgi:PPOX class probable F420-dependent enzyme
VNLGQIPHWARELLATARVGHLGLIDDDDRPRVLPVTFALAEGALWSAVDQKPKRVPGKELARVRWLRRRPQAALAVDLYDDDWSRLAWVQALCDAEILDVPEAPAAMSALVEKYPQYRERRPEGPLLRLTPRRFVTWRA